MKMIQLKWSDEEHWKNHEPAEDDIEAQLARLKASWVEERAKHKLKHDAEFRVVDVDLTPSQLCRFGCANA